MDLLRNSIPNYTFRLPEELLKKLTVQIQIENDVSNDWTLVESDDSIDEDSHKLSDWTKTTSFHETLSDDPPPYIMETHPDLIPDLFQTTPPLISPIQTQLVYNLNLSDDELDLEECYTYNIDPGYETEYSEDIS